MKGEKNSLAFLAFFLFPEGIIHVYIGPIAHLQTLFSLIFLIRSQRRHWIEMAHDYPRCKLWCIICACVYMLFFLPLRHEIKSINIHTPLLIHNYLSIYIYAVDTPIWVKSKLFLSSRSRIREISHQHHFIFFSFSLISVNINLL